MTYIFQSGNWAVEYDNAETGEHCHHEYATSDNAYEDCLYSQKNGGDRTCHITKNDGHRRYNI